ncbi:jg15850 [Pararge aegeria aegeria]|uniref:Jg15850 protein n=1 Tax=Pararge aegeria aegeria TaxID=348720 RepID=A0A8S4SNH2_9NEOP|nr:jg15850 [Pararge aegeria aegeria]
MVDAHDPEVTPVTPTVPVTAAQSTRPPGYQLARSIHPPLHAPPLGFCGVAQCSDPVDDFQFPLKLHEELKIRVNSKLI